MSAVAAMVGSGGTNIVVTVADNGNNSGYVSSVIGSISPSSYRGYTVSEVSSSALADLTISIDNGLSNQGFFRSVLITDGTGAKRRYNSADAIYDIFASTLSVWAWGDGTNRVYSAGDATEVKVVEFFL